MSEEESYQKGDGSYSNGHDVADRGESSPKVNKWAVGGVLLAALFLVYAATGPHLGRINATANVEQTIEDSTNLKLASDGSLQLFDDLNRYVLEDYDAKSTWSSFLPAVAGYFGKPVWVFYVNRGQGVATFGTTSKDYPILEFNPANKAYQMTSFWGFRTFIRGSRGSDTFGMEPFAPRTSRNLADDEGNDDKPKRILFVGTNEMEIQEIDGTNEISTNVQYFIVPNEDFAALVRRTTITNDGDSDLELDFLDGLAKMEPYGGVMEGLLKEMGRTLEGWMGVYFADDTLTMPFYKLSTEASDTANVVIEEHGNYVLSFIESNDKQSTLLPVVYDTDKVFGADTSLELPQGLMTSSVQEILDNPQFGWSKTSSAFPAVAGHVLKPGESVTVASIYGMADAIEKVPEIAKIVTQPGWVKDKFDVARDITNQLTVGGEMASVNHLFDGTVRQMFLDNGLRGGIPTILGNVDGDTTYDEDPTVKVFHSFSRIHGDLERDYNWFVIDPTYFSQGPGNFRDIAQNRRNDVTFFPRMGSFDIQMFLSYIQADAYEPLTVEAVVYQFKDPALAESVAKSVTADSVSASALQAIFMGGTFRPGQLFTLCDAAGIVRNPAMSDEEFINTVLAQAEDHAMGTYGEGYWGDHWDYYIDMIEAYLAVFPDVEEAVMYDKPLEYFFSTASVKPRSEKYILTPTHDGAGEHIQQLESTYWDDQKVQLQQSFTDPNTGAVDLEANYQHTTAGKIFTSAAIEKLFLLGSIKYATRDAYGMGIEYEGGRPGWLDSMNGLPGMVGSGMPETYELYLLLSYVKDVVDKYGRPLSIPSELYKMITTVNQALDTLEKSGYVDLSELSVQVPQPLFEYWDAVASAREAYRKEVQFYFSGNVTTLAAADVSNMIGRWLAQIDLGVARSFQIATSGYGDDGKSGIPATFFAFNITDWVENGGQNAQGQPTVDAKAMSVENFPMFLEGAVRYMKYKTTDKDRLKDIYDRVLVSGLRDTFLKMYFLSGSIKGQGFDMGRQVAFAPGWLENQSIWMHMSYKYYLQLIRGKLYDEFFSEMRGGGILPFMDPDVYGRSLMECSSFIASSAFPDPSIVGEGFLPRLSGTTAEFLDIWKHMLIGPNLFTLDSKGQLQMQLTPVLPSWMFEDSETGVEPYFDDDGCHLITFKLFGAIPVTYHNKGGGDLLGDSPSSYNITMVSGDLIQVDGPFIPSDTAKIIRRVKTVAAIDAQF